MAKRKEINSNGVEYCKEQGHKCCVSGLNTVMDGDMNVVYRV